MKQKKKKKKRLRLPRVPGDPFRRQWVITQGTSHSTLDSPWLSLPPTFNPAVKSPSERYPESSNFSPPLALPPPPTSSSSHRLRPPSQPPPPPCSLFPTQTQLSKYLLKGKEGSTRPHYPSACSGAQLTWGGARDRVVRETALPGQWVTQTCFWTMPTQSRQGWRSLRCPEGPPGPRRGQEIASQEGCCI